MIVNYSNQVVRMDMKKMMEQGHDIVAISTYRSTAVEIMQELLSILQRDTERPFYLEISPSVSALEFFHKCRV